MQVAHGTRGITWHVEFTIDDDFADRLRQLRSLVPPIVGRLGQKDLAIDKVRARLRKATWRPSGGADSEIDGSSIVFSANGTFSCAAKNRATRERLLTHAASVDLLLSMHATRPMDETLYIGAGVVMGTSNRALATDPNRKVSTAERVRRITPAEDETAGEDAE